MDSFCDKLHVSNIGNRPTSMVPSMSNIYAIIDPKQAATMVGRPPKAPSTNKGGMRDVKRRLPYLN